MTINQIGHFLSGPQVVCAKGRSRDAFDPAAGEVEHGIDIVASAMPVSR